LIKESIGLAIFMPNCAFQVELDRDSIDAGLEEIDEALDNIKVEKNDEDRIAEVMQNAFALSMALCNDEMDSNTAVSEMAFAFLYVYRKQIGDINDNIRGIISFLTKDYIHFSTCLEVYDFDTNVSKAKDLHTKVLGNVLQDRTPPKPTIH